ncbi:MAG: DUF1109 family protein [Caulobacteraceae bacterium]|nr:DUF1109 family protein [Caulobacter sp.]
MTDASTDAFIDGLAGELRPVRRLWTPGRRAAAWIVAVAALAAALASVSDLSDLAHRLTAVPDMGLAVLGSSSTAVLGAVAVFRLCLPDGPPRWALLPLPGLALWIAGTTMGCFRSWLIPGLEPATLMEARTCFGFIVLLSVPLSAMTILMVRRGYPLRPNLAAAVGGLAVAAAAATLLNFFHPYDVGVTDIAVHVVAIGLVILVNRVVGGRLLVPAGRGAAPPRGPSGR